VKNLEAGKIRYEFNRLEELFGSEARQKYMKDTYNKFMIIDRRIQCETYENLENEAEFESRIVDAEEQERRRRDRRSLGLIKAYQMKSRVI
jgi:hypothetical protein